MLEKLQIPFLLRSKLFVEIPGAKPFLIIDVGKQMVRINPILINFVKILGHLRSHTPKHADAIASLVQFRINGNQLKKHVDRIDQLDAAPLGHGFLNGEHLWQPDFLRINGLEFRTKVKGGALVGKDNGEFFLLKVVTAFDGYGKLVDEVAVHGRIRDKS